MVLSIIFLEDKHKIVLHLSIFYEYQQFFQHRICFSIQPSDYSDPWPRLARSSSFFLIMLFNYSSSFFLPPKVYPIHFSATTKRKSMKLKVSWSLMKGIQFLFIFPLFCFHGNCGKVCPTDSDFFGLSRSTRCGCCSYKVSSISVRRETCYDNFCVFQFLAFWPFPWQRRPFWKFQK
jgi:hypothetical protein